MNLITKRTFYDWILEVLSFLCLIYAFVPLCFYGKLNDEDLIPIHYNILGQANRWGPPSYLIFFSILPLIFYIILSILEKNYRKLNYPIKVTSGNSREVYRLGVRLVRHLKLILTLLFAYINNISYAVGIGKATGGNQFIMVTLEGVLLIILIYYFIRIIKYRA